MQKLIAQEHVPANTRVWNGYPNSYCTSPKEPGLYTLYELADDTNTHAGWEWVRES